MDFMADLGPGDYEMAKKALAQVAAGEASMTRVVAAFEYGGRDQWRAIVDLWEDGVRQVHERDPKHTEIAHITLWADGTADCWPGPLSKYVEEVEGTEPRKLLPWEQRMFEKRDEKDPFETAEDFECTGCHEIFPIEDLASRWMGKAYCLRCWEELTRESA